MDSRSFSRNLTARRFNRRNALKAKNRERRPRVWCETPIGSKAVSDIFLEPMADFLAGKKEVKPPPPPADLGEIVGQLDPHTLAAVILMPILNRMHRARGWQDDPSWEAKECIRIGRFLRDQVELKKLDLSGKTKLAQQIRRGRKPKYKFLKSDWTDVECVVAGQWMLNCAGAMSFFTIDDYGFPVIAPDWQSRLDELREYLLLRDPVYAPHLKPPPDWIGRRTQYDDRLQATFVRDWRPETEVAITEAFRGDFEHARGVNQLQRVPLRIDPTMLALVERFAVKVMNREGDQREADQEALKADLEIAKWIGDQPFYLAYNCDRRGRIYALQHFNYAREDHIRSLFKFANGQRLGSGDIDWLEIHCANCDGEGGIDKQPWPDRQKWVAKNYDRIAKIAADPIGTFQSWREADKPFAFVAACIELVAARDDPTWFETHLPIAFDASANGIQHLVLLCRDHDAAPRVNLVDTDTPQDVYSDVIAHVRAELAADSHEWAVWWRDRLAALSPRQIRQLLKTPAMTFAYNVTEGGMVDQMFEVWRDFRVNEPLGPKAAAYMARKIKEACEELLPGPAAVMRCICEEARLRAKERRFLEWKSPTGFPVANRYHLAKKKAIHVPGDGQFTLAVGRWQKINRRKTVDASAPNFVHSMDASHLIRIVNAAADEGITDVLCVHDSFACLAPQAARFNKIIRTQMGMLYKLQDHLRALCWPSVPPVHYGDHDPLDTQDAEYLCA